MGVTARDPAPARPRSKSDATATTFQQLLDSKSDRQSDDDDEALKQEDAHVDEEDEDEENKEKVGADALDVGVLIEAMGKCVALYHQSNKMEFYAMVAEEYGTLLPDCEDVSVDAIELLELKLQRLAIELSRHDSDGSGVVLPREVAPHEVVLVEFYKTLGVTDEKGNNYPTMEDDETRAAEPQLESPHSTGGHTDGSTSNPATPHENRSEAAPGVSPETNLTNHQQPPAHAPPPTSTELTTATATTASSTRLTDSRNAPFSCGHATSIIADLTKVHTASKQRLRDAEALLRTEKARTQQRKREYKELKAIVKQYRQRDEERNRLRFLIESDDDRDSDDSDRETERPPIRELRKLYRKETKRAKRLQENLSLKFQLLQSENQRHHMKMEQQMAELRNEYTDSYVFGP